MPVTVLTKPFKSTGSTLAFKYPVSATSFTLVGLLKNFDFGGTDIEAIETTLLASLAAEKIPSIPDNGDISVTVFCVPGDPTVLQLQTWSQASVTVPWQVQLPDGSNAGGVNTGTTINFNAFLSNFTPKGFEQGSTPTADITLTISGLLTLNLGS